MADLRNAAILGRNYFSEDAINIKFIKIKIL